jgi:hypothetical protein
MKRSYFTSEQIVFALRQAESGTSVAEICRKMGIVEQTFYRWEMGSGSISPFLRDYIWYRFRGARHLIVGRNGLACKPGLGR